MGTPYNWPISYKRVVLVAASLLVLAAYLTLCVGVMRLSTLLLH